MEKKFLIPLVLAGLLITTGCSFSFSTDKETDTGKGNSEDKASGTADTASSVTTSQASPGETKPTIIVNTETVISPNVTAEKPASITQVTNADQLIGTWKVISTGIPRGETITTIMKEKSYYKIVIDGKLYDSGYWTFAPYNFVLHTNAGEDIQPMKFVGLELYGENELRLTDSPFTRQQIWQRVK